MQAFGQNAGEKKRFFNIKPRIVHENQKMFTQKYANKDFLQQIKEIFRCDRLRYTTPHIFSIQRVAVCGGAGASFFKQALAGQADIYISGDFKYHDFFLTENRIMIADIGHYESEQFTKEIFYEILTKKISKFAVQFSEINTNPIKYL